MLSVTEYLKDHSFADLSDEFGIRVKEYDSGLVTLNYSQIESPKFHPIVDECRGLIVDKETLRVVSKSFNRFYNAGEGDHNKIENINLDDYIVYEKADGSIIKIYCHKGRWEISTRGTAYAESANAITGKSFRDMVLDCLGYTEEEFQTFADGMFHNKFTYVFEFISPFNRIVTPYQKDEMVLLGIIHNTENLELFREELAFVCDSLTMENPAFRLPAVYNISDKNDLDQVLSNLEGLREGFVLHNTKTGHRVKMKNLGYLKAHRIRGESGIPTRNDITELIVMNETAEFLVYFPEFQPMFDDIKEVYDRLTTDAVSVYNQNMHIESQKDFALAVKSHPFSSCMFEARAKNVSIEHAIANAKPSFLIKTILANV